MLSVRSIAGVLPRQSHLDAKAVSSKQDAVLNQQKANRSCNDSSVRCPITLESIEDFAKEDVFTTSSGIQYHKPSLKRWLQKHETLPHNNMSAALEMHDLWGHDIVKKRFYLSRQSVVASNLEQQSYEWFQNEALGLSIVSSVNFYLRRHAGDEILKNVEKFLYASMVFSLFVFIGSVIFNLRAKAQLDNLCPMTDEENKKAELGVDFYKS